MGLTVKYQRARVRASKNGLDPAQPGPWTVYLEWHSRPNSSGIICPKNGNLAELSPKFYSTGFHRNDQILHESMGQGKDLDPVSSHANEKREKKVRNPCELQAMLLGGCHTNFMLQTAVGQCWNYLVVANND